MRFTKEIALTQTSPIAQQTAQQRIHTLLNSLYPASEAEAAYQQVIGLLQMVPLTQRYSTNYFSERTVTLITYADTLRQPGEAPLKTLHRFLSQRLTGIFDTVHILPF